MTNAPTAAIAPAVKIEPEALPEATDVLGVEPLTSGLMAETTTLEEFAQVSFPRIEAVALNVISAHCFLVSSSSDTGRIATYVVQGTSFITNCDNLNTSIRSIRNGKTCW